jgi:2-oxoglutarate ferredoxin oxidoreductase subunit gamma
MRVEIRISGFGGQGIIRTGLILATAACVYGDKNAVQTASYGPESRGGRCKSEVIISSEEIDFPLVYHPDILVAMSQEAYTMYVEDLKKDGVLLVDPGLVSNYKNDQRVNSLKVPATRIAEKLGNKIVANVVMIGALLAITKFLDIDQVIDTIKKTIPPAFIEINLLALRKGYDYGKKLL